MNKNITPSNDKGQRHGLLEYYYSNGNLSYKGYYINGERYGPWEWYDSNGNLSSKKYYI